jgi:hypothetical protein
VFAKTERNGDVTLELLNDPSSVTVPLHLAAGMNTIEFSNPAAYAPDFEAIKVGYIGETGTLTFNRVQVNSTAVYPVLIEYCDGTSGATGRSATITVNGTVVQTVVFTPTRSFSMPGTVTAYLPLHAGTNTVEFSDPSAYAPDLNSITVSQ